MANAAKAPQSHSLLLYPADTIDSLDKMALGRKSRVVDNPHAETVEGQAYDPAAVGGFKAGSPPGYNYDSEEQGPNGNKLMNRIGPPLAGTVTGDTDSDSVDVGKLVELESNNAIKYRTCSWPKVDTLLTFPFLCSATSENGMLMLTAPIPHVNWQSGQTYILLSI